MSDHEAANKAMAAELDSKSASGLQKDMVAHKSEFINWRDHPTLNNVTKLSINYFEHHYDFDAYLEDRAKKDNKFVNPLDEGEKPREDDQEGSDFSMPSGGEDEEEDAAMHD